MQALAATLARVAEAYNEVGCTLERVVVQLWEVPGYGTCMWVDVFRRVTRIFEEAGVAKHVWALELAGPGESAFGETDEDAAWRVDGEEKYWCYPWMNDVESRASDVENDDFGDT